MAKLQEMAYLQGFNLIDQWYKWAFRDKSSYMKKKNTIFQKNYIYFCLDSGGVTTVQMQTHCGQQVYFLVYSYKYIFLQFLLPSYEW